MLSQRPDASSPPDAHRFTAKSDPKWWPQCVAHRLAQSCRSDCGGSCAELTGIERIRWVSTSATAPHMAGGYSFNGDVRHDPFSSKPMAELRGSSLHTRHWCKTKIMHGMLRSKSWVGFGVGAPSSP